MSIIICVYIYCYCFLFSIKFIFRSILLHLVINFIWQSQMAVSRVKDIENAHNSINAYNNSKFIPMDYTSFNIEHCSYRMTSIKESNMDNVSIQTRKNNDLIYVQNNDRKTNMLHSNKRQALNYRLLTWYRRIQYVVGLTYMKAPTLRIGGSGGRGGACLKNLVDYKGNHWSITGALPLFRSVSGPPFEKF